MKKKIDYAGIPKNILNMVLGETYGLGDYTLKDELDKYGEDIIVAQYNVKEYTVVDESLDFEASKSKNFIEWFRAWTKTYAMVMVSSGFGDEVILGIQRDIPKELNEKDKRRKSKR
jgi:hypothetical protein